MKNTEIYNSLKSVPEWAKKKINFGALKGKTDISPQWRIQAMTEQFGAIGVGWYYKSVNKWLEKGSGNNVCAFVDVEMFIKVDGEWSMPITGSGGNSFLSENKNGVHTSDECWKMATTDALSVAMKQLGVGADIYSGFSDSKYSKVETPKEAPKKAKFIPLDKDGNINESGIGWLKYAEDNGFDVAISATQKAKEVEADALLWMVKMKFESLNNQVQSSEINESFRD